MINDLTFCNSEEKLILFSASQSRTIVGEAQLTRYCPTLLSARPIAARDSALHSYADHLSSHLMFNSSRVFPLPP